MWCGLNKMYTCGLWYPLSKLKNFNILTEINYMDIFCYCLPKIFNNYDFFERILIFLSFFKDGWTALMGACFKGHKEVVEVLIKANANVDLQNKV